MVAFVKKTTALALWVVFFLSVATISSFAEVRVDGENELQAELDSIQIDTSAIIVDTTAIISDVADVQTDTTELLDETSTLTEKVGHIHGHTFSGELWFGAAASPTGETHIADRIGAGAAGSEADPFQIDAGNDDWGSWFQVFGSSDSPAEASNTFFDLHEMIFTDHERNLSLHILQISYTENAPGDDPSGANYSEHVFYSSGAGATAEHTPVEIQSPISAVGTKVWMRLRIPDKDTGTLDFYFATHEYLN